MSLHRTAKEIVEREVARLHALAAAGSLSDEDVKRLEALSRVAKNLAATPNEEDSATPEDLDECLDNVININRAVRRGD